MKKIVLSIVAVVTLAMAGVILKIWLQMIIAMQRLKLLNNR